MVSNFIERLGVLRTLMVVLLIVLIAMAPFTGGDAGSSDWVVLPSLIAPAFVPILVLVVLFDLVMTRVIMSEDERQERYGTVFWTYIALLFVVMIAWGPFYSKLF